jgi:hypothetical protein
MKGLFLYQKWTTYFKIYFKASKTQTPASTTVSIVGNRTHTGYMKYEGEQIFGDLKKKSVCIIIVSSLIGYRLITESLP